MPVTVYGGDYDTIHVEGDIDETFELADQDGDGDLLVFSDGTVLEIDYIADAWRIKVVEYGASDLTIERAPEPAEDDEEEDDEEDDEDDEDEDEVYSDRATLGGPIRWVAHCVELAKAGE